MACLKIKKYTRNKFSILRITRNFNKEDKGLLQSIYLNKFYISV